MPVSISYEHDPCDVDKARSLYAMKLFGGYTKEKNEDNLAMRKGILGYKGKIHIHFGKSIKSDLDQLQDDLHKNVSAPSSPKSRLLFSSPRWLSWQ